MSTGLDAILQFRAVMLRDIDHSIALANAAVNRAAEREGERAAREHMERECARAHEVLGREHTAAERGEAVGACREAERDYVKELSKP